MGLDTTHDCWHGPYSAFSRFRDAIADVADIPLGLMEGYYGASEWEERSLLSSMEWTRQNGGVEGGNLVHALEQVRPWLPIAWEALKPDALHILLNHSDCDGEIAPEDCLPLARRLEEIACQLPTDEPYEAKVRQFAAGLRAAAQAGETVEFR